MMWDNENPNQVFLIDGDISKTLANCATDANPSTRQEYGRILLYILRQQPLEEILKNIHDIISSLLMISEDEVTSVRIHLVDHIVSIILQIHEHASSDLDYYLYDRVFQILLKYYQDIEYMVKTEATTALNLLLDKGAIDKRMLIERVCPVILNYTKHYDDENEEGRTATGVALMGRIAPIVGGEALENLFLDNYLEMCSHAAATIRHPCASIYPVICQVLGTKITEERMVDTFIVMANSEPWSVRKICAENLALVASVCSPECRRDRLTHVVLKLAKDPNSHVVSATFKVLGKYIATFSTPKITGLAYTQEGELYITNPLDSDYSKHSDPNLVANYHDFINRFDEKPIQSQTPDTILSKSMSSLKITSSTATISGVSSSSSFSSTKSASPNNIRYNSDSLTCEHIAKIIQENIEKILNQINVDVLMKKRDSEKSYRTILLGDDSSSSSSNRGNCTDTSKLSEAFALEMSDCADDTDPSLTEDGEKADSGGGQFTARERRDMLRPSDEDLVFLNDFLKVVADGTPNFMSVESSTSSTTIDQENNSTKSNEDNLLNNLTQCSNSPGKKSRKSALPPIEHFYRKNTPTDLSSIIKNAIVEAKKLHQQPLYERRKLMLPPPPTASIDMSTPTSEEPSQPLAWDDYLSNDHYKSRSTDRLNECQADDMNNMTCEDDEETFNEFNSHKFWYVTPDIVLDNDLVSETPDTTYKLNDIISTRGHFDPPADFNQSIVPVEVLETYVRMVSSDIDEEVNLICAYNFPAVAFTIGKQNWHLLKKLLQYLCDDLDWKVRKTVATYIDQLAVILGRELATEDLLPIFIGFFKDLDQVKIKAIDNFAKFLKFIDFSKHDEILSNIGICLRIDSKTNWRIKEDLAQQILIIIKWYDSMNMHDYLLYLASVTGIFLEDKISCVREIGADAMAEIIRICNSKEREAIIKYYLVKEFSLSDSWRKRQTFVYIVHRYVCNNKKIAEFIEMVLQDMRRLSYDAVPNIRLLVAKTLVRLINNDATILENEDCEIVKLVRMLQVDYDRDVRDTAQLVDLQSNCRPDDDVAERIATPPPLLISSSSTLDDDTTNEEETTAIVQFSTEQQQNEVTTTTITTNQSADDSADTAIYNNFCKVLE